MAAGAADSALAIGSLEAAVLVDACAEFAAAPVVVPALLHAPTMAMAAAAVSHRHVLELIMSPSFHIGRTSDLPQV